MIPQYQNYNYPYYPIIQNGIAGKMVNNFNEINPQDVPMDGRCAIFTKNDLSEIQVKRWSQNGIIETLYFAPQRNEMPNTNIPQAESKIDLQSIYDGINRIAERLDTLEKSFGKKKKESADNE